ncbi:MAG: hypothetical protein ACKOX6_07630 [Bdellovibrio sp.]
MKITVASLLFVLVGLTVSSSFAKIKSSAPLPGVAAKDINAPGEELNMSEPPFWVSSYEEFQDLQKFQKDFYLEKLLPLLKEVPRLEPVSKKQLQEASEFFQEWNRIRKKIYEACQEKDMKKECRKIENIRLQALNLLSNQKLENRKADEESEKVKKSQ